MTAPRHLHQFKCLKCGATRDQATLGPRPPCGELHSETTRFPDGGWVRFEQWEPHGPMAFLGIIDGNPLQSVKDHADEVRARVAARREAAIRPDSLEAALAAKGGVYGGGDYSGRMRPS